MAGRNVVERGGVVETALLADSRFSAIATLAVGVTDFSGVLGAVRAGLLLDGSRRTGLGVVAASISENSEGSSESSDDGDLASLAVEGE